MMRFKNISILLLIFTLALPACGSGKGSGEGLSNVESAGSSSKAKVKTIKLTKAEFLKRVVNYEDNPNEWKYLGDKPAIVDFYADWCGPCKTLAPILEQLAAEYEGEIYIYKVDTEAERELASAFAIRSIPTMVFIPMGEDPQVAQGALPRNVIKEAIEKTLLKK
ncbi:MAG: thioredoxin [Bacteroidales bacterium]|jgi:thioredoxin|nr:thioredoxin [Bacteroidales bacterium]